MLRILWNLKLHYCVHKACHWSIIMTVMNPGHKLATLFKNHFNIIFPAICRSSKWSPFRFSNQKWVCLSYLANTCYMACQSHTSSQINLITEEESTSWSVSTYNFVQPPVTSSLLCPYILFNTPFQTLWTCLSLMTETKFLSYTKQQANLYLCTC